MQTKPGLTEKKRKGGGRKGRTKNKKDNLKEIKIISKSYGLEDGSSEDIMSSQHSKDTPTQKKGVPSLLPRSY